MKTWVVRHRARSGVRGHDRFRAVVRRDNSLWLMNFSLLDSPTFTVGRSLVLGTPFVKISSTISSVLKNADTSRPRSDKELK